MADSRHFFAAFEPPTATQQEHVVRVVFDKSRGKHVPRFVPSDAWEAARDAIWARLEPHRPAEKMSGAVVLDVTWCFPKGEHADGEPYVDKPDTDNLQKGLKDIMTKLGWWKDDAQVFSEHATKIYSRVPGIRIDIEEVGGGR
ncbi:MAG: RusA family crossover junction endodeoxyribonuclease [Eggerthellaceae bacterium]|nr:RusA family crossover junction endodeoxyribonuclease [Eggerthellaceae bacterium]